MKFGEAIQSVFSQYVGFSGRARRSEYWYFTLFNLIVTSVLEALGQQISLFSVLGGIYALAVLLPGLAVCIRRLHDIGKSGWWYLILLVPLVGVIILLVWFCRDGDQGDNQYGPSPKYSGVQFDDQSGNNWNQF